MTQNYVIDQVSKLLIADLKKEDCDAEQVCRQYVQMALSIGIEHFTKDMEEIAVMTNNGEEVARYKGVTDASNKTGIRQGDISAVLIGKQHSAGGFMFMKVKDKELIPVKKTA